VVGLCVNGEVPSNGALGRLYGQRARVPIRGRWTLIRVGYRLGRPPSATTEGIPRSSDLLAAPHSDLGEKLAPQARQVFRSLDEVVRSLPRSPGLWIRFLGPLAGRLGFWQVGSTWQGWLRPWSVGTHGYPCLSPILIGVFLKRTNESLESV
jgi:hypothetical protein